METEISFLFLEARRTCIVFLFKQSSSRYIVCWNNCIWWRSFISLRQSNWQQELKRKPKADFFLSGLPVVKDWTKIQGFTTDYLEKDQQSGKEEKGFYITMFISPIWIFNFVLHLQALNMSLQKYAMKVLNELKKILYITAIIVLCPTWHLSSTSFHVRGSSISLSLENYLFLFLFLTLSFSLSLFYLYH